MNNDQISQAFGLSPDLFEEESSFKSSTREIRDNFYREKVLPEAANLYVQTIIPIYLQWYLEWLEWESSHYADDTDLPWFNYPKGPDKPLGILRFRFTHV